MSKIINTLCISGGGVKGISFLGALSYLLDKKHIDLNNIHTYIGSSVGSIISLLFVLGYSIDELIDFILNFNFEILEPNIKCENIFTEFGFSNNDKIVLTVEHFIKSKINKKDVTFIDLYNITNNKLIITGTNITDLKLEYFDYINTPNMLVVDAIRISTCIPIIFAPIKYNNKYYIDGCIAAHLPINNCNINTTLGLIVKSTNIPIDSITSVLQASISILINSQFKNTNNIIIINDSDSMSSAIDFTLNNEYKTKLIDNGKNAASKYIESNNINTNNDKNIQTDYDDKEIIKLEINITI
jgi:NTE family protein